MWYDVYFYQQFNLPLHKDSHSAYLGNLWEDHSLFPMFWIEEFADLDETYKEKLNDMLFTPLKIVDGAQWTMVSLGQLKWCQSDNFDYR